MEDPIRLDRTGGSVPVESAKQGPLSGLLVVSAEQAVAGPLATSRLVDAGARVIKIERRDGDSARGLDDAALGASSYFEWINHGKESLFLDFKDPDDAALLHRMLARADVFVQNIAPGALARAGFGSDELRARYDRLVTCDISGYGVDGPASTLKAYDMLVQAESGLISISGAPAAPGRIGVSICDIGAGMNAAIGVLAALLQRQRTGRGTGVSVSLFDGAADWMTVPYVHERYGAGASGPVGVRHPTIAPYGAFRTRDGHGIIVALQNEREWSVFADAILGRPELGSDARFSSNVARVRNRAELDTLVSSAIAALDLEEAKRRLSEANIAFGQMRSVRELIGHPALRTWPMESAGGTLEMVAPPVRAEWDAGRFPPSPAPGENDQAVRREFASNRQGGT